MQRTRKKNKVSVNQGAKDSPMPFSDAEMKLWGYVGWRCLADGTVIAVAPMGLGNGRLFWDVHQVGYSDFFCYEGVQLALESMTNFDPSKEKEPYGWHRHASTGRRRPEGDHTKEYINM